MIPDIQSIFDSTVALDGGWFYVGKYSVWTLYGTNITDGAVSVEAASVPSGTMQGVGNYGIQLNNVQNPAYQPTAGQWYPSFAFALNALVVDYNGNVQKATTGGVSGPSVPTWAKSGTTTDGTVVWTFQAAQGNPNFNSAPKSSATPQGVVLCPSMSTAGPLTTTGVGTVLVTGANSIYIPDDDTYVGYIRVRKVGGGALETIVYISGQVDS